MCCLSVSKTTIPVRCQAARTVNIVASACGCQGGIVIMLNCHFALCLAVNFLPSKRFCSPPGAYAGVKTCCLLYPFRVYIAWAAAARRWPARDLSLRLALSWAAGHHLEGWDMFFNIFSMLRTTFVTLQNNAA